MISKKKIAGKAKFALQEINNEVRYSPPPRSVAMVVIPTYEVTYLFGFLPIWRVLVGWREAWAITGYSVHANCSGDPYDFEPTTYKKTVDTHLGLFSNADTALEKLAELGINSIEGTK